MSAFQHIQFFPYLEQITSMRGCVVHNDFWPWPISSRLFSCDIAYLMVYIQCGTNKTHEGTMCYVPFPGQRSRSHGSFDFLRLGQDHWSTISSLKLKQVWLNLKVLFIFHPEYYDKSRCQLIIHELQPDLSTLSMIWGRKCIKGGYEPLSLQPFKWDSHFRSLQWTVISA